MNPIIIEIDGQPVAKGRGQIGRMGNGRPCIFTPAKTRANENLIKLAAMGAMRGRDPIDGAVRVKMYVYLAPPVSMSKTKMVEALAGRIHPCTKPDLDNYIKSALDGLNTIVFVDDNQVISIEAYKYYRKKPAMKIEVWPVMPKVEPTKVHDII